MAVNRFMQPAQQSVMSNYVPIPFDAMAQAGAMATQRYEQALEAEQGIEDIMGSARGIDEVQTLSQGIIKAHGQDRVNAEINRVRGRIDQLHKDNPDYTSLEYRTGLRSVYNDLKRSMSSGILGKEMSNYEALQEIYKKRSENTDLLNDPSLGLSMDQQLMQYAGYDQNDYAPNLNPNVGIPDYVDVEDEMNKVLGDIKETFVDEGFTGSGIDAYNRWVQQKGVTSKRVEDVAFNRLNDPRIKNTMMRRAQWEAMQSGDTSSENVKKIFEKDMGDLLKAATSTYVRESRIDKFLRTKSFSGGDSDKYNNLLSRGLQMRVPGLKGYGFTDVLGEYKEGSVAKYNIEENKRKFMEARGIKEGSNEGADGVDYSKELKYFNDQLSNVSREQKSIYDKLMKGMKVSGFSDDEIEYAESFLEGDYASTIEKQIEKFMSYGDTREEAEKRIIADYNSLSMDNRAYSIQDVVNAVDKSGTNVSIMPHLFTVWNPSDATRFENYMEKRYGDKNVSVNVNTVDSSLRNHPLMKLDTFNYDFNSSIEDIKDLQSGTSWTENDYEDFDPKGAKLVGWANDPSQYGKKVLVYSIPARDKDNKDGKLVKVDPPQGFEAVLYADNNVGLMDNLITDQAFKALEGIQYQTPTGDPTTIAIGYNQIKPNGSIKELKKTYDIDSADELDMDYQVMGPEMTGVPNHWKVGIPTIKGGKESVIWKDADSLAEASGIIRSMYRKHLETLQKK